MLDANVIGTGTALAAHVKVMNIYAYSVMIVGSNSGVGSRMHGFV